MTSQATSSDRFGDLADRREIDDVLYRYAHALDSHDWDRLRTCFTEDAVADFLELGGVNEGIDAIVELISGVLSGLDASQHLIGSPIATVDGGTAKSSCYLQAQHVFEGAPGGDHYLVGGTYVDELVRTPEGWRIKHRTLHASWMSGNPGVFEAAAERLKANAA
jgi:ketosteroid isomerase-like protein